MDDSILNDHSHPNAALSTSLMRSLGERSYERRKAAAVEIESLIRDLNESGDTERICRILALLGQTFAASTNSNHRKGGLLGLAACAIGLLQDVDEYLDVLIPPILHCFEDPESRVRYYACESLYNVAKVARGSVLRYFNSIFEGLCKLFADSDVDVKNGANLLDRLVKDIVTEADHFDVEAFIPLLQKHIRRTNPYVRQLIVGWITVLDSVPDIQMLDWIPEILDGLFSMLSDGNKDIRQAADFALSDFLRDIRSSESVEFLPMVGIIVFQAKSKDRFSRLTAMTWLLEFIHLGGEEGLQFCYADLLGAIMWTIADQEHEIKQIAETANEQLRELVKNTRNLVDGESTESKKEGEEGRKESEEEEGEPSSPSHTSELTRILQTLIRELLSENISTRIASLGWIYMLLDKVPLRMLSSLQALLPVLLKTLNDESDEVLLFNIQVMAKICVKDEGSQFQTMLYSVLQLFARDARLLETRGAIIIRKLCVLLDAERVYLQCATILDDMAAASMQAVTALAASSSSSSSNESKGNDEDSSPSKTNEAFQQQQQQQQLSVEAGHLDFVSMMVQTLNLILLTSLELKAFRMKLKQSVLAPGSEENGLFSTLFKTWCHNIVAAISLCLLAQTYDLSSLLLSSLSSISTQPTSLSLPSSSSSSSSSSSLTTSTPSFADVISVGFLMQCDKLISLIESPIFLELRLQMLEISSPLYPYLMKTLYSLLMLLPQSSAYKTLSERLNTCHQASYSLQMLSSQQQQQQQPGSSSQPLYPHLSYDDLVSHFTQTCVMHTQYRNHLYSSSSLLYASLSQGHPQGSGGNNEER
jgi:vacuole morphology and inheritance protein 14